MEFPSNRDSQINLPNHDLESTLKKIEESDADKAAREKIMLEEGIAMAEGNEAMSGHAFESGILGVGVKEIEKKQQEKTALLKKQIELNEYKLANIEDTISGLKKDGHDTTEFEERLASAKDELERQKSILVSYEAESTRMNSVHTKNINEQNKGAYNPPQFAAETVVATHIMNGEEGMDVEKLRKKIYESVEAKRQGEAQMERDQKDTQQLTEFLAELTKAQFEFQQIKSELTQKRKDLQDELNSPELASRIQILKENIEKNFRGGLRLIFKTKLEKEFDIRDVLNTLIKLREEFKERSRQINEEWNEYSRKSSADTIVKTNILYNRKKDSEIGIQVKKMQESMTALNLEIENSREKEYDFEGIDEKIISPEEIAAYQLRIKELA